MYRKSQAMATEAETTAAQADPHFLQRVVAIPVVTTAIDQLANIYQNTKESNRYVKYTLETAEVGVKTVAQTAMPVVNRLEKPIGAIDSVACNQLNKLEEKYPIITKPTEEVVEETKKVYETTLKPRVDTVTGMTQSTMDKVESAKQYTVDTISATKQYTVDTVSATKQYTVDTVTSVKDYTANKVSDVKNYTYNTVAATASYGKGKVDSALETQTGQTVISKVDQLLEKTEQYVDYYLPGEMKEGEAMETETEKPADEKTVCTEGAKPTDVTFGKLVNVSDKVRRRMYAKSMKDLQNIQRRSKETLDRLNFTVDLIEYAQANIDGAKARVSSTKTKFLEVWEEINQEEGETIEMSNLGAETNGEGTEEEKTAAGEQQISNATLEKRAIATARHLTSKLKRSFQTMMNTTSYLPTTLQTQISGAKSFTENLYTSFTGATTLQDVPTTVITQTRSQLSHLQETLTSYTDYMRNNYFASWIGSSSEKVEDKEVTQTDKDVKVKENEEEMETETAPKVVEEEMKEDAAKTE